MVGMVELHKIISDKTDLINKLENEIVFLYDLVNKQNERLRNNIDDDAENQKKLIMIDSVIVIQKQIIEELNHKLGVM